MYTTSTKSFDLTFNRLKQTGSGFLLLILVFTLEGCILRHGSPVSEKPVPTLTQPVAANATPIISAPAQDFSSQDDALIPAARPILAALTDLPRYTIEVTLNTTTSSFTGTSRVDYFNNETTPLDRLYFRLFPNGHLAYGDGALTVSRVTLAGQEIQSQLSISDTVLEIPLSPPLASGGHTWLEFNFNGRVPIDSDRATGSEGYGIFNFAENVLTLSGWFPMLAVYDGKGWHLDPVNGIGDSVYSDMVLFNVDIAVDRAWIIAATGTELNRQTEDTITHHRFVSGPVRDFFIAASPDFQINSQVVGATTINSYSLPKYQAGRPAALHVAADAVQLYTSLFGQYPYTELDIIGAPLHYASGVEYPGIVLIGETLYDAPKEPNFYVTVAHEVAHQWWYNVVGNDVINDPWMDEALTSFSSGLYLEERDGAAGYDGIYAFWNDRYQKAVQEGRDDLVTQSVTHFEQENPSSYGAVVYSKGALFFDAVRKEIGAETFAKSLREYYAAFQYKVAAPDDLLNVFETAAGHPLKDLYQKWLYSSARP